MEGVRAGAVIIRTRLTLSIARCCKIQSRFLLGVNTGKRHSRCLLRRARYIVFGSIFGVVLEGTPKKRRRNRALCRFVCRLAESAPHVLVVLLLVVAAAVVLLLLWLLLLFALAVVVEPPGSPNIELKMASRRPQNGAFVKTRCEFCQMSSAVVGPLSERAQSDANTAKNKSRWCRDDPRWAEKPQDGLKMTPRWTQEATSCAEEAKVVTLRLVKADPI